MKEEALELIRDYLDGRIDAKDLDRLNRILESDAEARAEFRAMATMEEGLRDLTVVSEVTFPLRAAPAEEWNLEEIAKPWYRNEKLGIAAMFVICLGLTILLWRGTYQNEKGRGTDRNDEWGDAIAKIEFLSEDVGFEPGQQLPTAEGSLLGKGWVQLERGRVRLLFRSGAAVEAEGPAALGIDTPTRAFLDFGKVNVHAPGAARDFVIATESMEVVDLGTRFEVEVDPKSRESNVSVIEGLVDLHLGSRGTERVIQPLEAGYAARVDAFGKIVEITDRPGSQPGAASYDPAILAHWTFDEVGADGRVEDSAGTSMVGKLLPGKRSEPVPGVSGKALDFSKGESVDLSEHISVLDQLEDFTFAAWVRDPGDPIAMAFSISGDTEQHRVQLYLARGFIRFGWQDGLHFDSVSGRVDGWNHDRWYHVAVAVQDGIAHLYRDGELIASGSVGSKIGTPVSNPSLVTNASHASIGRLQDGRQGEAIAPQWFQGAMDDVQIYSGALSHEGIQFVFEHPGKVWLRGVARQ